MFTTETINGIEKIKKDKSEYFNKDEAKTRIDVIEQEIIAFENLLTAYQERINELKNEKKELKSLIK
jgi:predicted RNase H-like nuclease (RuvC/YqgF family)